MANKHDVFTLGEFLSNMITAPCLEKCTIVFHFCHTDPQTCQPLTSLLHEQNQFPASVKTTFQRKPVWSQPLLKTLKPLYYTHWRRNALNPDSLDQQLSLMGTTNLPKEKKKTPVIGITSITRHGRDIKDMTWSKWLEHVTEPCNGTWK